MNIGVQSQNGNAQPTLEIRVSLKKLEKVEKARKRLEKPEKAQKAWKARTKMVEKPEKARKARQSPISPKKPGKPWKAWKSPKSPEKLKKLENARKRLKKPKWLWESHFTSLKRYMFKVHWALYFHFVPIYVAHSKSSQNELEYGIKLSMHIFKA